MITYPEPTMPRSTRHLAERAEAERERPISEERERAIVARIRRVAEHARVLRRAGGG